MDQTPIEAPFADSAVLGAPDLVANSPWVVLKFGGTSVSTADNWLTIAGLLRNRLAEGLRPVLVHSALAGVSNCLEEALATASAGKHTEALQHIREQHYALADALGVDAAALLDEALHELDQLVAAEMLSYTVRVYPAPGTVRMSSLVFPAARAADVAAWLAGALGGRS